MRKHTDSPWVITEANNDHLEIKGQKRYVALLFRVNDLDCDPEETPGRAEAAANARLIAQAPTMLRLLCGALYTYRNTDKDMYDQIEACVLQALGLENMPEERKQ